MPPSHINPRPHDGPPLPTHPSRCTTCGYVISLEVHDGVVADYCRGCARNRQRAGMRLPPLSWFPQYPTTESLQVRRQEARQTRCLAQVFAIVPTGVHRAQSTVALACLMHRSRSGAHNLLRRLERAGRIGSHNRTVHGKVMTFWFAPVASKRKAA